MSLKLGGKLELLMYKEILGKGKRFAYISSGL